MYYVSIFFAGVIMKENEKKDKVKLPIIYVISAICSGIFIITGIILLICLESYFIPLPIFLIFFGVFLIFVSLSPLFAKISIKTKKYILHNNKEDLTDTFSTGADVLSPGVKTIAKTLKNSEEKIYCKACGKEIEISSKYCKYCGIKQD